ncbi:MAG: hypothetical protein KAH34_11160 [Ketobacter sp.]|nr:hypothetical protein [Ketobacter sp.]
MNFVKSLLLLAVILGVSACSGGGTNSSSVERNTSTSSENDDGNTDNVPEPEPPFSALLDGNIYFPVSDQVTWYYSDGDEVMLQTEVMVRDNSMVSMQHTSAAMPRQEYFLSDGNVIQYGGLFASLSGLPGLEGVALEGSVEFHNLRRVYDPLNDRGQGFTFSALDADLVAPDGEVLLVGDYYWRSVVGEKSLISTGQMGSVPAVELQINIDVAITYMGITLQRYPLVVTSMWLSPGLGIVARSMGETMVTLDRAEGIQAPVVFVFDQGDGLVQSPQQLLIDGNPVTDMEPQVAVAYGTRETDWLSVEFDATGSWRASIIGAELPRGIHGAVVQVSRGESRVDVPVSVLVN